jgi:hypothetical protein
MEKKDPFTAPHLQYGYSADEPQIAQDSSATQITGEESGSDNRGRRAAVTKNGEVVGSGASAGGKGGPEDFDSDPQAGGGAFIVKHEKEKPNGGADASQHNST